ncbi:synaptogyrin-2-like [Bombina bombina]|uniref:synaptogyrin-2-like n=1 Tax=Bombina bombina TaxID=8345 RepID=UPI00235AD864|nr:synaptogyrin-2-like [Bombina bombina]
MERGAYGAAKAGGSFNLEQFLRRPETIFRICACLFAMIVFACIVSEYPSDREGKLFCIFGRNNDACHYGVGIGVLAFIGSLVFLGLDIYFPTLNNANYRKYLVLGDLGFSGLWSFLWFVGFCFLTNQWSITDPHSYLTGADNARAAIAFSFFSILTWIPLAFLAYKRYTAGVDDFSTDYVDPSQDTTTPYSSYPNTVSDSYQQPPFTQNSDTGEYQPPAY